MPRYKLTLAYDGTDFCGWQKQEPPVRDSTPDEQGNRPRCILRTVQDALERAVREVVGQPIHIIGASRTDSGVHARGQVAAFTTIDDDAGRGWPAERGTDPLKRAINARLPEDALVVVAEVADPGFDPIGDCTAKRYTYTLWASRDRPLWRRRLVHHVWTDLDLARMQAAAALFVGEHDFAAFAAAGHGRLSTVRTVFECQVNEEWDKGTAGQADKGDEPERLIVISVTGNGFLWHMVRIIAGTLYEVGRAKMSVEDAAAALAGGDRNLAGPTMPAGGLCLEWVRYENSKAAKPQSSE